MGSVFISYSNKDPQCLKELQSFLQPLQWYSSLTIWTDTQIKQADDWKAEIDSALSEANIALVLVTPNFLASEFIYKHELPYLLEKYQRKELTLIPVFFHHSLIEEFVPALTQLKGCGTPDKPLLTLSTSKRQEEFKKLGKRLIDLVKPKTQSKPSDLETGEYALSIYVEQQAGECVTQYRIPGREPFLTTRRDWDEVWQGLPALMDWDAASQTNGQILFDALFGEGKGKTQHEHDKIFRSAFQQLDKDRASPTPLRAGLRLRIASPMPEICRLPWRLTTWQGHVLAQKGWVFLSGQTPDPVLDIHTTVPNHILLLDGLDSDGSHRLRLHQTLQAVWNDKHDPLPYVRRPDTLAELKDELAISNPHWVYVHGQIEKGVEPLLRLGTERLPLRVLANLLSKHPPAVLFINTEQDPPIDLAGYFPKVPLVLFRQRKLKPADPLELPVAWLQAWLRQGLDPVVALHQLQTDLVEIQSLAFRADYRYWRTDVPQENLRKALAHLLLDRISQKGRTNEYLSNLVGSNSARVMALVPYGEAGNHMGKVHEQLLEAAKGALHGRAAIYKHDLQFPPSRQNLRVDLEHELAGLFEAGKGENVELVLKRLAPNPQPGLRPLLWLHWGLFGKAPEPSASSGTQGDGVLEHYQAPLNPQQLTDWLGFVSDYLATRCPNTIRLVCSLSIEAQADKHAGIARLLNETKPKLTHEKFQLRILPPLDKVPSDELLDFLTDHAKTCPQDIRAELAERLIDETQGSFEKLSSWLEQAEVSRDWIGLLNRLRLSKTGTSYQPDESF